jgi:hypothetical protein
MLESSPVAEARQTMGFSPSSFALKRIDSVHHSARQRFPEWTKPDNQVLILTAVTDLMCGRGQLVLGSVLLG